MPFGQWTPDVVIGIDFGMTCTGVAYSAGPEWADPKTIRQWPAKATYETRNKVDTAISYSSDTQALQGWGLECDDDDVKATVNRLFKLFLDPKFIDVSGYAPTHGEVQQWFIDYLASLYAYVLGHCQDRIPRLASKNVEWLFSIPTTWKDASMIADVERMIKCAGYGTKSSHKISISMTEAEAAAVYVSRQQMQMGDVFLVCDAGGGTTDINLLKVIHATRVRTQLEPLHWNEGAAVGSALIDYRVEKLLLERLQTIQEHVDADLEAVARDMIQGRFMSFKCAFGSGSLDSPKLALPVPGMPPGQDIPHASIENSKLVLTREELQQIFDEQIAKICDLIDSHLGLVSGPHAGNAVSYILLSGGLGSSPYVRARIKERYERSYTPANVHGLSVLVADEPQLAVVHGLVMARTQALRAGPEVLTARRCPVSYGVVSREIYDPARHLYEEVERDPFDKRCYAEGQVLWFIKQGELVDDKNGVSQRFRRKIALGQEEEPWKARVVMSSFPPHDLPRSTRHHAVTQVCTVETVLDLCDMTFKNSKWYHLKKMYRSAEFDVKLIVGTGLRFEIWGKQGCKSKAHEEITIQWEMPELDSSELKQKYFEKS